VRAPLPSGINENNRTKKYGKERNRSERNDGEKLGVEQDKGEARSFLPTSLAYRRRDEAGPSLHQQRSGSSLGRGIAAGKQGKGLAARGRMDGAQLIGLGGRVCLCWVKPGCVGTGSAMGTGNLGALGNSHPPRSVRESTSRHVTPQQVEGGSEVSGGRGGVVVVGIRRW
jgi:hypothetical protein